MSTPGEMLSAIGREARARLGNGRTPGEPRVFRGRTVDELIPRIQRELGSDAIILRRREGLTGGVLGFFQQQWVEIEAVAGPPRLDVYDEQEAAAPPLPQAAETLQPPAAQPPPHASPAAYAQPLAQPPSYPEPAPYVPLPAEQPAPAYPEPAPPLYAEPAAFAPPASEPPPAPAPAPPAALPSEPVLYAHQSAAGGGGGYVTAHLAAVARENRARLTERPLPLEPRREAPLPPPPPVRPAPPLDFHAVMPAPAPAPLPQLPPEPEPQRLDEWRAPRAGERRTVGPGSPGRARAGVEKGLRRYGISERMIGELIDGAVAHVLPFAPRSGLAAAVRAALAQRIPVAPPLPLDGATLVVVGSGGAGKTTCCTALLGAYRQSSSLAAAFATIAREPQHGELQMLLAPQLVRPTPVENPRARRALQRARAGGLLVLDTPRVSPAERTPIKRLGRVIAEVEPERVLVAMPATLGGAAAAQLLESLAPLKPNAMIITHAEETDQVGVAVEAACRFGLAPEFMLDRGPGQGWRLRRLEPAEVAAMVLR
jgi:hypothetical protein